MTETKSNTGTSTVTSTTNRPSKLGIWILASRPHTLTASIAPVIVGSTLVSHFSNTTTTVNSSSSTDQWDNVPIGFIFGLFACLIQLGTNLHNDYADFVKGADTDKRVGQARATQKGWLTPTQTATGASLCLLLAFTLGIYLIQTLSSYDAYITNNNNKNNDDSTIVPDIYMSFVTISSVFNAVAYTGGPYPLGYIGLQHVSIGYSGLGDLFVFLYFGIVATITVPYLHLRLHTTTTTTTTSFFMTFCQNSTLLQSSLLISISIGCLATAIIVVNNLRDRITDIHARKLTMAVRFGEKISRMEYTILILLSYILLIPISRLFFDSSYYIYLPILSFPLAMKELKAVGFGFGGNVDGAALNKHVGRTAKVQLLFCILLSTGIYLSN